MDQATHERFMRMALEEAALAHAAGEPPIGAVIVRGDEPIARAHNEKERRHDPTAHAEIIAIAAAAAAIRSWRLLDCRLYVTLEPCPMCAGAIVHARLSEVIFGASDPKSGACGTLYRITEDARLNHQAPVVAGVLASECSAILTRFFAEQRAKGKK